MGHHERQAAAGGDFDGDGRADSALYRPSASDRFFLMSSNNTIKSVHFGMPGDTPVSSLAALSQQ
jgi:hypothetical protein